MNHPSLETAFSGNSIVHMKSRMIPRKFSKLIDQLSGDSFSKGISIAYIYFNGIPLNLDSNSSRVWLKVPQKSRKVFSNIEKEKMFIADKDNILNRTTSKRSLSCINRYSLTIAPLHDKNSQRVVHISKDPFVDF